MIYFWRNDATSNVYAHSVTTVERVWQACCRDQPKDHHEHNDCWSELSGDLYKRRSIVSRFRLSWRFRLGVEWWARVCGGVCSLVCGTRGRGFNSRQPDQTRHFILFLWKFEMFWLVAITDQNLIPYIIYFIYLQWLNQSFNYSLQFDYFANIGPVVFVVPHDI